MRLQELAGPSTPVFAKSSLSDTKIKKETKFEPEMLDKSEKRQNKNIISNVSTSKLEIKGNCQRRHSML